MKSLKAPLGRAVHRMINPFWRRIANNKPRARVLVVRDNEVLLVINTVSSQNWRLPGGGRHTSEEPVVAARRELKEELRLDIDRARFTFLGVEEGIKDHGATIQVELFQVELHNDEVARPHPLEILDHKWFPIDALPARLDPVVHNAMKRYQGLVDNVSVKT